jgi:hypothetical protein
MSEIKAGDLVMIVKPWPCCGRSKGLGKPFTVLFVRMSWPLIRCPFCDARNPQATVAVWDDGTVIHVSRLKKIPPLSEPVSTQEEATA